MVGATMPILVAEPDRDLLNVLDYVLRRGGYNVLPAPDGLRALALWQTSDPALVLLEVQLPALDGWEVCRRIRSQRSTPLIFLTTVNEPDAIIRGLDLGADDYVTKPFDPWQLLARIRAVLRRSRPASPESTMNRDVLPSRWRTERWIPPAG
jgi:DNA-binding response OmpR family regulator